MKFEISFVPDVAKESYKTMHTPALDNYAAELVERIRGPAGYLDVYEMMDKLDDQKFRTVNRNFIDFMTQERWVEYIKAYVAAVSACGMTNYTVVECSKILDSIKMDYRYKAIAVIEVEIPDDFVKDNNLIDAVFRDICDLHESHVNALWKNSFVAKYSRVCVDVV